MTGEDSCDFQELLMPPRQPHNVLPIAPPSTNPPGIWGGGGEERGERGVVVVVEVGLEWYCWGRAGGCCCCWGCFKDGCCSCFK